MCTWRRRQHGFMVIWILLIGVQISLFAQDHVPAIQTAISPSVVRENESFTFTVTLTWEGSPQDFEIIQFPQFKFQNILLVESGAATRSEQLSDSLQRIQRVLTFHLKPLSAGDGKIYGGTVVLRGARGEHLRLSVPETTLTIVPGVASHPKFLAYIYLILLGVLAIAVVYSFILYMKKKRLFKHQATSLDALNEMYRARVAGEVDPKGGNLRQSVLHLQRIVQEFQHALGQLSPDQMNATVREQMSQQLQTIERKFQAIQQGNIPLSDGQFLELYQAVYQLFEIHVPSAPEEHVVN